MAKDNYDGSPPGYEQAYPAGYPGPFIYPIPAVQGFSRDIPRPSLQPTALEAGLTYSPLVYLALLGFILLAAYSMGSYFWFFGAAFFWFHYLGLPTLKMIRRYRFDSLAAAAASGSAAA